MRPFQVRSRPFLITLLFLFTALKSISASEAQKSSERGSPCVSHKSEPGPCFRIPEYTTRSKDHWNDLDLSHSSLREGGFDTLRWKRIVAKNVDARGARLTRGHFYKVDFENSALVGAYLARSFLQESSFVNCNMNGIKMSNVIFHGGSLRGSTFKGAILKDVVFKDVEISKSSFEKAQCIQCDLRNVKWLP